MFGMAYRSSICSRRTSQCLASRPYYPTFIVLSTVRCVRLSLAKAVCRKKIASSKILAYSHAEINAASSMTALTFSPLFDFTKTYFMVAGIAGVSPRVATLGSVTFARYAIQVALQYEFDAREIPDNFTTG